MHRWQLGAGNNSEERKESLPLGSEGKEENKHLKLGVLKKKCSITESKDTTFSEAIFFKNVNILCQQKRAFEIRTRITLSFLPTIKPTFIFVGLMKKISYSTLYNINIRRKH